MKASRNHRDQAPVYDSLDYTHLFSFRARGEEKPRNEHAYPHKYSVEQFPMMHTTLVSNLVLSACVILNYRYEIADLPERQSITLTTTHTELRIDPLALRSGHA